MWPLFPLSHTFIGITITSRTLTCTWVEPASTGYLVKANVSQPLHNYEVIDGALYNPSVIKQYIQEFLHTHNIIHAYAVMALERRDSYTEQQIMHYQLLALAIPLRCIMITASQATADETEHALYLYKLGKQIHENAS